MSDTMREAIDELAWLRKTASDERDFARIVGFEDCLRKWQATQAEARALKESMQRWIDHHSGRADKAEELVEELARALEMSWSELYINGIENKRMVRESLIKAKAFMGRTGQ